MLVIIRPEKYSYRRDEIRYSIPDDRALHGLINNNFIEFYVVCAILLLVIVLNLLYYVLISML